MASGEGKTSDTGKQLVEPGQRNSWRELRLENDLTLGDLASRSELTKGFLSQVEQNLTMPEFFVDEQAAKRTMKFLLTRVTEGEKEDERKETDRVSEHCQKF